MNLRISFSDINSKFLNKIKKYSKKSAVISHLYKDYERSNTKSF